MNQDEYTIEAYMFPDGILRRLVIESSQNEAGDVTTITAKYVPVGRWRREPDTAKALEERVNDELHTSP